MVDRGVHRRCRPRVRRADPAVGRRRTAGCAAGAGHRVRRGTTRAAGGAAGARRSSVSIPPGTASTSHTAEPGEWRTPRATAGSVAVRRRLVRHGGGMSRLRTHRRRRRRDRRGRPDPRTRGNVLLLPQSSDPPGAWQRVGRRPHGRPTGAVLAARPVPRRDRDRRGGRTRGVDPVHPSPDVALRERAGDERAVHREDVRGRRPHPGFLEQGPGYAASAAFPPA